VDPSSSAMIALALRCGRVESTCASRRIAAGSSLSWSIAGPTFGMKPSFCERSSIDRRNERLPYPRGLHEFRERLRHDSDGLRLVATPREFHPRRAEHAHRILNLILVVDRLRCTKAVIVRTFGLDSSAAACAVTEASAQSRMVVIRRFMCDCLSMCCQRESLQTRS